MDNNREIKPIAIPGIHARLYDYLMELLPKFEQPKILDIGAGHGYLVKKLHEAGYDIMASDLFPEYFYYDKIECQQADITKILPFNDNSFDVILAVELMEHVHDHEVFFKEANRILKKDGMLLFTTPNILSLKSRMRFLYSGFYYSFGPLDHQVNDGLQHKGSLTIDQYRNLSILSGFSSFNVSIDKRQSTSMWLSFLIPIMKLYCYLKKIDYNVHNQFDYLTGRVLFAKLVK